MLVELWTTELIRKLMDDLELPYERAEALAEFLEKEEEEEGEQHIYDAAEIRSSYIVCGTAKEAMSDLYGVTNLEEDEALEELQAFDVLRYISEKGFLIVSR